MFLHCLRDMSATFLQSSKHGMCCFIHSWVHVSCITATLLSALRYALKSKLYAIFPCDYWVPTHTVEKCVMYDVYVYVGAYFPQEEQSI